MRFDVVVFSLVCSASLAKGASSAFTSFEQINDTYTTVVTTAYTLVPSGTGYVGVGYFKTLTDTQFPMATAAELTSDFVSYSEGRFGGQNVLYSDGSFSLISDARISESFVGKTVYFVTGNGNTLLESTQAAIVRNGTFPFESPPYITPFDRNLVILTEDSTNVVLGTLVPVVQNSLTSEGLAPAPTSIQLARIVPEPFSLALFGLGGLLAIRRRR